MQADRRQASTIAIAMLLAMTLGAGAAGSDAARAGDTGSRILDSPSRDVYRRDLPALRSIVPGGNLTSSDSLSGMIGELGATGGLGRSRSPSAFDCVLHHQRLERTTRQLFAARCNPSVDVDTGYPAYTTR